MILERIKEYLENMSLARLSPDELKVITECAILIEQYNDNKVIRDGIHNELNNIKVERV